jgi:hypothetical protein
MTAAASRRALAPLCLVWVALLAALPGFLWPATLVAQAAPPRPASGAVNGAVVSGLVHDSLAHQPLVGAMVQLVGAAPGSTFLQSALSDSIGRYVLRDIPDGRYTIGFFHPVLDSLGLEPTLREVLVQNHRDTRMDLASPSAARLRRAVCGPAPAGASAAALGGVLLGTVHDARQGAPLANATVTVEWLELSFGSGGVTRRTPRLSITTRENGWYALCQLPNPGSVWLAASRSGDSTDVVEVPMSAEGVVRRELYVGAARTVVRADSAARPGVPDSLRPPPRKVHVGEGRLTGGVVALATGRPLNGVQVGVVNGPGTRTNERGEFTLTDAPAGTRMLEVRAVGYYPERRAVNIIDSAPPEAIRLNTLRAVLDTVRVAGNRIGVSTLSGYAERQRTGMGRFFSDADVQRRNPIVTSDLFRNLMSGVYLDGYDPEARIEMRSVFEERCVPTIYVNDRQMPNLSAGDLDSVVKPAEIRAMEVYNSTNVPAQFQVAMNGCGAIVIWTKTAPP